MKKKRFVKLLMSKGIQRNKAQQMAALYNSRHTSYKMAYLFCNINCALNKVSNSAISAAKAISASVAAFKDWSDAV